MVWWNFRCALCSDILLWIQSLFVGVSFGSIARFSSKVRVYITAFLSCRNLTSLLWLDLERRWRANACKRVVPSYWGGSCCVLRFLLSIFENVFQSFIRLGFLAEWACPSVWRSFLLLERSTDWLVPSHFSASNLRLQSLHDIIPSRFHIAINTIYLLSSHWYRSVDTMPLIFHVCCGRILSNLESGIVQRR